MRMGSFVMARWNVKNVYFYVYCKYIIFSLRSMSQQRCYTKYLPASMLILFVLCYFNPTTQHNSQSTVNSNNNMFSSLLFLCRSLKCARITLHMNLFASFAVNNFLWLLWYRVILADHEILTESGVSMLKREK